MPKWPRRSVMMLAPMCGVRCVCHLCDVHLCVVSGPISFTRSNTGPCLQLSVGVLGVVAPSKQGVGVGTAEVCFTVPLPSTPLSKMDLTPAWEEEEDPKAARGFSARISVGGVQLRTQHLRRLSCLLPPVPAHHTTAVASAARSPSHAKSVAAAAKAKAASPLSRSAVRVSSKAPARPALSSPTARPVREPAKSPAATASKSSPLSSKAKPAPKPSSAKSPAK
jgi:hypothetical protein